MSDKDKGKKKREAKRILQKHIGTVTSVLKANPNNFYLQMAQDLLVHTDAYDPDDKTMNKQQQATHLYKQCMTAVEITPSHFPKVLDILNHYPQLDEVVDEMKKRGEKAGLMQGSDVLSTSEEDDDEEEECSDHGDDDESKKAKQKVLPTKRTKGSSDKPSKKQKVDSSNGRTQPSSKAGCKKSSSKNSTNSESDSPGSSSGLDREPTNDELEKLVANKVADCGALGIMLHLETVQIDMIKDEERSTVVRNRRILAQWKEEGTRKPITWRTLIGALQDMKMNKLAHQLMEKFGEKT